MVVALLTTCTGLGYLIDIEKSGQCTKYNSFFFIFIVMLSLSFILKLIQIQCRNSSATFVALLTSQHFFIYILYSCLVYYI